jgi:Tripartite tricarboxylate transporter family receptor
MILWKPIGALIVALCAVVTDSYTLLLSTTALAVREAVYRNLARVIIVHVPYKGLPQAVTDLIGGRLHLIFASPATSLQRARDGKLRLLAVTTAQRSSCNRPSCGSASPLTPPMRWAARQKHSRYS